MKALGQSSFSSIASLTMKSIVIIICCSLMSAMGISREEVSAHRRDEWSTIGGAKTNMGGEENLSAQNTNQWKMEGGTQSTVDVHEEGVSARGMDEWSMMGGGMQPEVLIVKEKGGNGGGHPPAKSGMDMKDLTPIICLLAPLLLAAIMIPAKMTMMMNGLMAMNPMIPPMMPMTNGMLPMIPMMPTTGLLQQTPYALLSAMLTGGNSHNQQLPIFKNSILSKEFTEKNFSENNTTNDYQIKVSSHPVDKDRLDFCKKNKNDCKKEFYNTYLTSKEESKQNGLQKRNGMNIEKNVSSRVWNARSRLISVADQILNFLDEIENILES